MNGLSSLHNCMRTLALGPGLHRPLFALKARRITISLEYGTILNDNLEAIEILTALGLLGHIDLIVD